MYFSPTFKALNFDFQIQGLSRCMRTLPIVESFAKCTVVNLNMPNNVSTAVQYSHNIPKNKYECFGRLGDNKWRLKENDLNVYFQKIVLFCNKGLLSSCTHSTHANSPGLPGSLLDTDQISCSPIRSQNLPDNTNKSA